MSLLEVMHLNYRFSTDKQKTPTRKPELDGVAHVTIDRSPIRAPVAVYLYLALMIGADLLYCGYIFYMGLLPTQAKPETNQFLIYNIAAMGAIYLSIAIGIAGKAWHWYEVYQQKNLGNRRLNITIFFQVLFALLWVILLFVYIKALPERDEFGDYKLQNTVVDLIVYAFYMICTLLWNGAVKRRINRMEND